MSEEEDMVRCHLCGNHTEDSNWELLSNQTKVHRKCFLGNFKFLKATGLVRGIKEKQETLVPSNE